MTTAKQKPPKQPYILCIGKWTSLALTAEAHGFGLNGFELEEPKRSTSGIKPIGEVVAVVIEKLAKADQNGAR